MSESTSTARASILPKVASMFALVAFIGVFLGVRDAESIDVYGVSVPVWAFSIGMYLLGVLAMWGAAAGAKK